MLIRAGEIISEKFNGWVEDFLVFSPNIIAAILVLVVFFLLSIGLRSYFYKISGKIIKKRSLKRFITSLFQISLISIGVLIALSILNLGKAITSILAGAGVAGLVIGFAMQEVISNYFSGITISVGNPFHIGDLVEVGGELGTVEKIEFRTTIIRTPTGQILELPNRNVINNNIINYTQTGERRIDIEGGIAYGDDWKKAKDVAIKAVKKINGVNTEKPIEFFYSEFGGSSLNFVLRFWMEFGNSQKDMFELKSEAITTLLDAYEKAGITMPYPTSTVRVKNIK